MNQKEAIFKTLRHEKTDQVPWIPFACVHAGKLLGYTAEEVLKDEDKLFDAMMRVNKLYKPSGQPMIFDLQVEAECLGCQLKWADDAPPSVSVHPLADDDDLTTPCYCTIPRKTSGRIPLITNVMRRMKEAVGDTTALYGLICGPFTLAAHLRGNDIFMDMYDDEDAVIKFLAYCNAVAMKMSEYYTEAGMDVIAVVDPLISQISADHFRTFMSAPFIKLFDHIRNLGAFSSFFVCGDATRNIEEMCRTGPDSISVDENVDIIAAKAITDRYNIAIGGNIPLTTVMLYGTQQDNMKFVIDLLDSIKDKRNFILAPGCDMPYGIPPENTIGIVQAVREPDSVKEMLKNYVAADDMADVELPDYGHLKKPLLEVFTLDSASCAACAYMLEAAIRAKVDFGDDIDMAEYKFTVKENIARCKKMGVKKLPSIYINGELKFASIMPAREDLEAAIRAVMK